MAAYDYINQSIQSTALITAKTIDSFYYPTTQGHTGYAWDGTLYAGGVQVAMGSPPSPIYASWFTEGQNAYRGILQTFPQTGLVLLSKVALTILDGSNSTLALWMQFLLQNNFALADNFNGSLNGWSPSGLAYADGILSVVYTPDAGSLFNVSSPPVYDVDSNMVVNIDFSQDTAYLDVAI
jgi:hypothetical protein